MKRYLSIFILFIKYSLIEISTFRLSFYNSLISHIFWGGFQFASIFLLTSKTGDVFGWKREELFLLTGVFNLGIGIFRTLIAKNMDYFNRIIDAGGIDSYLLKPIDAQFTISLMHINIGAAIRIPISIIIIYILLKFLNINPSFFGYVIFCILLFVGLLITYSVWYGVMTIRVWYTNLFNLRDLLSNISGISRYPWEMFENTGIFLFFIFFPISSVISIPTKFLLGRINLFEIILYIFTAFSSFYLSRIFWKFALRYYTSASS